VTITRDRSFTIPSRIKSTGLLGYDGERTDFEAQITPVARVRTGQALPHWKQIIADGGNATTPFSAVYDTVDERPATYRVRGVVPGQPWIPGIDDTTSGYHFTGSHYWARVPKPPTIDISNADNRSRAKFFKAVRAQHTKFNGVTFVGELRESLHMIRHPAQALYKNSNDYLGKVKKLKRQAGKEWTKKLGGLWLEHAFGWVPLLHDIQDGYSAYVAATKPESGASVISASFSDEVDVTNEQLNGPYAGMVNASWGSGSHGGVKIRSRDTLSNTAVVRYKGKYVAQVEAPRIRNQRLFGFTPSDFVPAAWELLPWSFLVDYFTNIGDIVEASVTSLAGVKWVNRTVIRRSNYVGAGVLAMKVGDIFSGLTVDLVDTIGQDAYCETTRKEVTRTPNTGIDFPRLTFDTGLSRGQLGNIAALLTNGLSIHPQRFRRKI
jgi:hypothetical protein